MSSSSPAKAIAGLIEGVTGKMGETAQGRGARRERVGAALRSLHLSHAPDFAAGSRMACDGSRLHDGQLQRHLARQSAPDHVCGAAGGLDQYFCQTLLPDFIRENPAQCARWDVAWDDRGHFAEPHTGKTFGVGTLNVRDYVGGYAKPDLQEAGFAPATITTSGPGERYAAILYIEKEGFLPLLERARMAEKFDIAIMSCKGMSVTAARQLLDQTCARFKVPCIAMMLSVSPSPAPSVGARRQLSGCGTRQIHTIRQPHTDGQIRSRAHDLSP